jgi:hypothetical protein
MGLLTRNHAGWREVRREYAQVTRVVGTCSRTSSVHAYMACMCGSHRAEAKVLHSALQEVSQLNLVVPHEPDDVALAEDASGRRVLKRVAREQPMVHLKPQQLSQFAPAATACELRAVLLESAQGIRYLEAEDTVVEDTSKRSSAGACMLSRIRSVFAGAAIRTQGEHPAWEEQKLLSRCQHKAAGAWFHNCMQADTTRYHCMHASARSRDHSGALDN